MFHVPEKNRVTTGPAASDASIGNYGVFDLMIGKPGKKIKTTAIVSSGMGWEHVSVTLTLPRCPTWEEMCEVKSIFWDKDDVVIQYHPAEKDYVSCHPFCLHLWRPTNQELPVPHSLMVGPSSSLK